MKKNNKTAKTAKAVKRADKPTHAEKPGKGPITIGMDLGDRTSR